MKVGGEELGREHQLAGLVVSHAVGKLGSAKLIYQDGAASTSDFPLSNAEHFAPGAEVEVLAGAGEERESLFKGVVVRHALSVRSKASSQLVVECRHKAVKLATARKNACFFDQSDSEVIEKLLGDASVDADIESTSVKHAQQVQYRATDWDFVLLRARANGLYVIAEGDAVSAKKPKLDGEPAFELHFGSTLLELDAEIDARSQLAEVKGVSWDPAAQELIERDAADPSFAGPGNLASDELAEAAGAGSLRIAHASLAEDEAQALADAAKLTARINKLSGVAKCEGVALRCGSVVKLSGVGKRASGDVFVTGVRHEYGVAQGWKTWVQFGGVASPLEELPGASAPRASALAPAVSGLQIGVVVDNEDPDGEQRVRVRMPLVDSGDGVWARVAALDAGKERGFFFRPEVDDEVVLGCLDDDPRRPVILGMLHSSAKPAPLEASNDNHEKVIQTRSKLRVHFDDEKKILTLETPGGNKCVLDDDAKGVRIEDQNGNKIELGSDGITIESAKALKLKAGSDLECEASAGWKGKAGAQLAFEGSAGAELKSSASTTIKGSVVQIN